MSVRLDAHDFVVEILKRSGANRRETDLAFLRIAVGRKLFDATAQLFGQSQISAVIQFHKTRRTRADQFHQLHHVQRKIFVDGQLS